MQLSAGPSTHWRGALSAGVSAAIALIKSRKNQCQVVH